LEVRRKTLVPQVIVELKKLGREDILVAAIFGPGSPVTTAAVTILELLLQD
jgi:methylmalonyl-CoA mutase